MNQNLKLLLVVLLAFTCGGCAAINYYQVKEYPTGFHAKITWRPDDYFSDYNTIRLCNSIKSGNIPFIEKDIAGKANVKAVGRDGMTPLLWAFAHDQFEAFEYLLNHGADPEVPFKSDFGTYHAIEIGSNVFHTSAKSHFPKYFLSIMKHEGDPDAFYKWTRGGEDRHANLFKSILYSPQKYWDERCKAVLEAGPSKEVLANGARLLVRDGQRFDIALQLLKAGADYKSPSKLDNLSNMLDKDIPFMEDVANAEYKSTLDDYPARPSKRKEYLELVAWLEAQGEDFKSVQRPLQEPFDRTKAEENERRSKEQINKRRNEYKQAREKWEREQFNGK
jgi:hypothetical protein